MKIKKFVFGKYEYNYALIREDRKSLSLTVRPDLSIILKAPESANQERIQAFLCKKWLWLEKQLKYFKKYQTKIYEKEYVSGESFLYLGKQYKLKVIRSKDEGVLIAKGVMLLKTKGKVSNGFHNKKILEAWYLQRTTEVFGKRYVEVQKNFNYDFVPELEIRKMAKRWGSFLGTKKIYLNPELIKAPTVCIDYVITHELCHMKYKNHSEAFFTLLKSKLSDWEKIKERLELLLGWQIKV